MKQKKLTDIADFGDAPALAKRLVDSFQSLPWKYSLSIKLPSELSDLLSKVADRELGPNMRLVKATKSFAEK